MDQRNYGVRCLEILPGVFSSERLCKFRAYHEGNLVNAYVHADEKLIEGNILEAQVLSDEEDRALVRVQNAENFTKAYVPKEDLVEMARGSV